MSHGHQTLSKIIGCPGRKNLVCHIPSPSLARVAGVIRGSECSCPHLSFSPPDHHHSSRSPRSTCFPWWNRSFSSFLVSDFWPLEPCSSFLLCLREGNLGGRGWSYSNWKLLLPPNGFSNIRAGKLQLLSWHLPKLLVARPSPQPLELVGMELKTCVFPLMLLGLWALSDRMKRMFLGFDTCKNTPPSPWPCVAACQDRNKAKFSRVLSALWPWLKWLPDIQQGRPKGEKCVVPWSPKPGVTRLLDPDCGGLSPVTRLLYVAAQQLCRRSDLNCLIGLTLLPVLVRISVSSLVSWFKYLIP